MDDQQPTAKIAAALSAFQADMPTVGRTKTANLGTFGYKYADLADVQKAAMPLLAKHGLAFTCLPQHSERGLDLVAQLLHNSGEALEGTLPITGRTPQEIGSSLTYMRRYLFGCLTGVVTDADDDGAAASKATRAREPAQSRNGSDTGTGELLSEPQKRLLMKLMGEHGLTERPAIDTFVEDHIGRRVATRSELTKREATTLIDALKSMPKPAPTPAPSMDTPGGVDPWQQQETPT